MNAIKPLAPLCPAGAYPLLFFPPPPHQLRNTKQKQKKSPETTTREEITNGKTTCGQLCGPIFNSGCVDLEQVSTIHGPVVS